MPRAYAGMISRQLVERIIETHGALFGGVSPDIYSAALISMESRKSYRVDFPIVVPGACAGSTSGKSARGRHVGGLRDNAHIGAFKNLVWDERVPEYYSVPTVWGYSLLKGIEDMPQWLRKADFSMLYLRCLISDPQYKGMVMQCLKQHARQNGYAATAFEFLGATVREAIRIGRTLAQRQLNRLKQSNTVVLRDILDTEQAFEAATQYIRKLGKKLELTKSGS